MVGMLQVLTYMFAFYLVLKALEFIHRAMAAGGTKNARPMMIFALVTLAVCVVAAGGFILMQDDQAMSLSTPSPSLLY